VTAATPKNTPKIPAFFFLLSSFPTHKIASSFSLSLPSINMSTRGYLDILLVEGKGLGSAKDAAAGMSFVAISGTQMFGNIVIIICE
jgi:hypothetical protein